MFRLKAEGHAAAAPTSTRNAQVSVVTSAIAIMLGLSIAIVARELTH